MNFEKVMGVEVHVELNTKSKIFCSCSTAFGAEPNTHVCPTCLGMPGALPVLNKEVVSLGIKTGLALNCKINKTCRMDRKNYFYVDSPKSYQITQDVYPICRNGYIDIEINNKKKRIGIERIHMEDDAGKLIHKQDGTFIDFNRAGVPLLEIVSKPHMNSSEEVILFLKSLKDVVSSLGVSDCKMEEGSFRCDLNISLKKPEDKNLGVRAEIKNINSFKSVEKAIMYEYERQSNLLKSNREVLRETRGWDDSKEKTFTMREKEEGKDYRYFPEGDLVTIKISDQWIENIKSNMPELPEDKLKRYKKEYGLSKEEIEILISDSNKSSYFEKAARTCKYYKGLYNFFIGEVFAYLKENNLSIRELNMKEEYLAELINLIFDGKISNNIGKKVFNIILKENKNPLDIIQEKGLTQNNNKDEILELIREVLEQNNDNIQSYKNGKTNLFPWFVGQVMKRSRGKANPKLVKELMEKELNNK